MTFFSIWPHNQLLLGCKALKQHPNIFRGVSWYTINCTVYLDIFVSFKKKGIKAIFWFSLMYTVIWKTTGIFDLNSSPWQKSIMREFIYQHPNLVCNSQVTNEPRENESHCILSLVSSRKKKGWWLELIKYWHSEISGEQSSVMWI